jgi:hypothetical protein
VTGVGEAIAGEAIETALKIIVDFVGRALTGGEKRRIRKALSRALRAAMSENQDAVSEGGVITLSWQAIRHSPAKLGRAVKVWNRCRKAAKRLDLGSTYVKDASDETNSESAMDWRDTFADALYQQALAGPENQGGSAVVPSGDDHQGLRTWSQEVSRRFALNLRADPRLAFLVAQLDVDDQRAWLAAGVNATRGVSFAVARLTVVIAATAVCFIALAILAIVLFAT